MRKAIQDDGLQPLRICERAPAISQLLFLDDSFLFLRATATQAMTRKDVLSTYYSVTQQLINVGKCSILLADCCSTMDMHAVKIILGVIQGDV